MKTITLLTGLVTALGISTGAMAAGKTAHIHDVDFPFEGPFGAYDKSQLQRGLQVYTEICASCHGLQYVPLRALEDLGYSDAQVRQYISDNGIEAADTSRDAEIGDTRPAIPADHFPANTAAGAPDLSLMAKARAGFHGPMGLGINQFLQGMGGPEYIANLLQGYVDPPECGADADIDGQYNKYFAVGGIPDECKDEAGHSKIEGSWISMGQPLYGDDVEYADGHSADLEHVSEDVAAFLMWTAEPHMDNRKHTGLLAVVFLLLLTVLLYLTNKKLWAPHKGKGAEAAE